MLVHAFNPSTQEAGAGGSLWVWGQPGLQSEFQDNHGYTDKPCFEKQNKNTKHTDTHIHIDTHTYNCKGKAGLIEIKATAQVCFRAVLYPSWVKRSSVLTAMLLLRRSWPLTPSRGCILHRHGVEQGTGGRGHTQSMPPLPFRQCRILSFSFQAWPLEFVFLFLKGRSNTLTGFPYRITSLLCSHFRELSSHVHGIVFTKLFMEFSELFLPLCSTGDMVVHHRGFIPQESVSVQEMWGNRYCTFQWSLKGVTTALSWLNFPCVCNGHFL